MKSPQEPSDAIVKAEARKVRLATAFKNVFGQERARTEDQKIVMEHLKHQAAEGTNSFQFQGADGIAIIASGIHRDGAKSQILTIDRQLFIAANLGKPKKAKPETKR